MLKKIGIYTLSILIAVGVGALAGLLTQSSMPAFEALTRPPLTPPALVFPIVWTALFVLMGIGAAMIFLSGDVKRRQALAVYAVQLAVNFFWSLIFFNMKQYLFAFFWLLLLWLLILLMIRLFFHIRKAAGILQIPYLLWVTFAGYLNFMIWLLNR